MEVTNANANGTAKDNNPEHQFITEDPLCKNDQVEEKKRSFGQKIIFALKNITVEPCATLYVVPYMITAFMTQNLALDKACLVNLNFSDEICDLLRNQSLGNQNEYERETQKLVSSALAVKTYMTATLPCLLAILVGSYSDITGHRKIFMTFPMIGQILVCANSIINIYFYTVTNIETFMYVEAAIEALSGGVCVLVTIVFSFISAITTTETRTFRMGLVNFALTLSFPIGTGASGILLKKLGYYGTYGLAASLHTLNLAYTIFVLRDPPRNPDQKQNDRRGVGHFFRTFFDFNSIKDTVNVIVKKTPDNRRLRLCVLLLVVTILIGPLYGETSILYMSTRYRFNWDEVQYSIFQAYNSVTHATGSLFSISVFSKYLQWHDSILGIISTLSKIAGSFVYCFAPNGRIFFIAPIVEILNGTSSLAMRSIVSKIVQPNELGKINSVLGLTENLMPLFYVSLYTQVYAATMEMLPGFVFLMGALMTIPAVIVFFWLLYEHRKNVRRKNVSKTPID